MFNVFLITVKRSLHKVLRKESDEAADGLSCRVYLQAYKKKPRTAVKGRYFRLWIITEISEIVVI